jgi:general secretion pathway protein N
VGCIAVWIATLLGAGGRIAPVDAGDRAAPPLPALAPAAPERIASAAAYADIGARPLFAEDRKPRPYLLGGTEPGSASSAVTLTGVLLTSEFGMAILTTDQKQSLRLRLNGDAVNGWQLVALEPRSATVSGPGGTQTLELVTFSGQGGEPPTVLGTATAGGPQAPGVRIPPPPPSTAPPATGAGDRAGAHCAAAGRSAPRAQPRRTEPGCAGTQRRTDASHPCPHPGAPPAIAATATVAAAPRRLRPNQIE